MAHTCREIAAPPSDVFAVLADPEAYPDWLIGAANIRSYDDNWPSPGAKFHHTVGVRPFVLMDSTEVIDVEPDESLVLHVRARPLVSAVVTFRLIGKGDRCVISMEEEPTVRTIGNLVRPILDPATHVRNHRSLGRLEKLVLARKQRPSSAKRAS